MCSASERANALNALSLVENVARLATQGLFGFVFAALAQIGKSYMTFFANAVSSPATLTSKSSLLTPDAGYCLPGSRSALAFSLPSRGEQTGGNLAGAAQHPISILPNSRTEEQTRGRSEHRPPSFPVSRFRFANHLKPTEASPTTHNSLPLPIAAESSTSSPLMRGI